MERQRVDSSLRLDPTSFILHRLAAAEGRAGRWDSNRQSLIPNPQSLSPRHGYTLVELLMATALSLMVMFGVVTVFGMIGQGVNDSRATLEMSEALRSVAAILRNDLAGVTVTMDPPRRSESGEGYFEYTEGPIGPILRPDVVAFNTDVNGPPVPDSTVGDIDDMLLLTPRSRTEPFVGRYRNLAIESHEAEIAYFVRGRTLYRRVLLIVPALSVSGMSPAGFYAQNDLSVRADLATGSTLTANTLADLTKPENRYAHRPRHMYPPNVENVGFPFHPHFYVDYRGATPTLLASPKWGPRSLSPFVGPGLPTLCECSAPGWSPSLNIPWRGELEPNGSFDAWKNPHPWTQVDPETGYLSSYQGPRVADDVILNNVIGFDVKAWDPGAPVLLGLSGEALLPGDPGYVNALRTYVSLGANQRPDSIPRPISYGAYVDLNYMCLLGPEYPSSLGQMPAYVDNLKPPGVPLPQFGWAGDMRSYTRGTEPFVVGRGQIPPLRSAVYDTWSTHYEAGGPGANGFDDPPFGGGPLDGVVDDPSEMLHPPPYAVPLRGIQVKIRCYELFSRQIREVTIVQEFVTK